MSTVRIALTIEYDGTDFAGWQKQADPALPTVQSVLEKALSRIADSAVATVCAGRTDAGVHACSQVVHFDTWKDRGEKAWTQGVNSLLPKSVRVHWARPVPVEFHARFRATARRYHYVLFQRQAESAILAGRVTHWRQALDIEAMNRAVQCLIGEQDFAAFRAAGCQSRSSFRNVHAAQVWTTGPFVIFDIQANAFLQHMVRNIMGSLLSIGAGARESEWMAELLQRGDRRLAAATARPDGLYLVDVAYPDGFGLPVGYQAPPFLPQSL